LAETGSTAADAAVGGTGARLDVAAGADAVGAAPIAPV